MVFKGMEGIALIGLFGGIFVLGCASGAGPGEGAVNPPEWVHRMPGTKDELCAVGVSGPTYYNEDARANSKTLAMTELARTLEVKVTADMTMRSQGDSRGSETVMQEVAGFASEVVLKQAQIREQWVHSGGDPRYGSRGTIYTLVCMPLVR
ncbi:MAG: hypothetical protein NT179_12200 [Nitrospirae bacterium]|nr:hypothetical protein [Nitrospirota bacterium]